MRKVAAVSVPALAVACIPAAQLRFVIVGAPKLLLAMREAAIVAGEAMFESAHLRFVLVPAHT